MGYYDSVEISASGLSAERLAMDVIANNIANANTTRTPEGGAFKRQLVIFAQKPSAPGTSDDPSAQAASQASDDWDDANDPFAPPAMPDPFDSASSSPVGVEGVSVAGITDDPSPDRLVFDPGNPDADARGYVHYPNVEIVKEMVDLMAASRAYQANVAAITASQNMGNADLNILKS
jgi:flagellar basal-body rod protein FlgC